MTKYPSDACQKAKKIKLLITDIDGIFNDGRIHLNAQGREVFKSFSVLDGIGLRAIKALGISIAVISGRASEIAEYRFKNDYQIDDIYLGYIDKKPIFDGICRHHSIDPSFVCYIGDDLPDKPCIEASGFGVSVPNGADEVTQVADWITPRNGGMGAIRSLCDLLVFAHES